MLLCSVVDKQRRLDIRMTPFRFSATKAAQAVAVLLMEADGHSDDLLRVLKLLYIADRTSIKETGTPITGDSVYAMPHGPVLSRVYNLIKSADPEAPEWQRFIEKRGNMLRLVKHPGNDDLCPYEVRTLQAVFAEHSDRNTWEVAEDTHGFDEYRKNWVEDSGSSFPIPYKDIFEAVGRDDYDEIARDEEGFSAIKRLLER